MRQFKLKQYYVKRDIRIKVYNILYGLKDISDGDAVWERFLPEINTYLKGMQETEGIKSWTVIRQYPDMKYKRFFKWVIKLFRKREVYFKCEVRVTFQDYRCNSLIASLSKENK